MSMNEYQFYQQDLGTNYGQSRYFCYYLQENGLLTAFYHKFHANCKKDPTGYETLKQVLGENDQSLRSPLKPGINPTFRGIVVQVRIFVLKRAKKAFSAEIFSLKGLFCHF
jgi:hypothetical protein